MTKRTSKIIFYDSETIQNIQWPTSYSAAFACQYILPYVQYGTQSYINNVNHQVLLAVIDDQEVVPIIINNGNDSECYLTSPYSNYIESLQDFVEGISSAFPKILLQGLLSILIKITKKNRFDKIIYINNWLLSTGPQVDLSSNQIAQIMLKVKQKYPDHAVCFKGIKDFDLIKHTKIIKENSLRVILSRQIYLWNREKLSSLNSAEKKIKHNLKIDSVLFKKHNINVLKLNKNNLNLSERLAFLYKELYLKKYFNSDNPQYSNLWFENILKNTLIQVCIFSSINDIKLFQAYYHDGSYLVNSIVGFDSDVGKKTGLYRISTNFIMQLSCQLQIPLNLSDGVGQFKMNRGAIKIYEYDLIDYKHLSFLRRLSWGVVFYIYHFFGKCIVEKLDT